MAVAQLRPRIGLTATEQANIKEAYGYLITSWPAVCVDAALGNAGQESSWNPIAVGDGGASKYFWQWQAARRVGNSSGGMGIETWCAANGLDPNTIYAQCMFLKYELPLGNGMGPVNAAKFLAGGDLTELTTLFSQEFERPSQPDLANRIADAEMVQAFMSTQPVPTPTPTPTPIPIPTPTPPPSPPPSPPIIVTPPPSQPAAAQFDPISIAIIDVIIGSIFKWGHNLPTMPGALPIPITLPPALPPPTPIPVPSPTPSTPTVPMDLPSFIGLISSLLGATLPGALQSSLPGVLQSVLPGQLQSILPGILAGLPAPLTTKKD